MVKTKEEWAEYYSNNKEAIAVNNERWRKKNRERHPDSYYWGLDTLPEAQKECCYCGELKHVTEFAIARDTKDGFKARCKLCADWLRTKCVYGLDDAAYYALIETQQYQCALCAIDIRESTSSVIDHSHTTGEVRGILCRQCNIGLGAFRDAPDILEKAIKYVS